MAVLFLLAVCRSELSAMAGEIVHLELFLHEYQRLLTMDG